MKKIIPITAVLMVLSLTFFSASIFSPPVETLDYSGQINGMAITTAIEDETIGICRALTFEEGEATVKTLICHKDDGRYELYRTYVENTDDFDITVGAGTIDDIQGFDSFTSEDLVVIEDPEDPEYIPEEEMYEYDSVEDFPVTCESDVCEIHSDETIGVCRTVIFEKMKVGWGGLQVCHKGDSRYEAYYQEETPAFDTTVCVNGYCVDEMQEYNSFTI